MSTSAPVQTCFFFQYKHIPYLFFIAVLYAAENLQNMASAYWWPYITTVYLLPSLMSAVIFNSFVILTLFVLYTNCLFDGGQKQVLIRHTKDTTSISVSHVRKSAYAFDVWSQKTNNTCTFCWHVASQSAFIFSLHVVLSADVIFMSLLQ